MKQLVRNGSRIGLTLIISFLTWACGDRTLQGPNLISDRSPQHSSAPDVASLAQGPLELVHIRMGLEAVRVAREVAMDARALRASLSEVQTAPPGYDSMKLRAWNVLEPQRLRGRLEEAQRVMAEAKAARQAWMQSATRLPASANGETFSLGQCGDVAEGSLIRLFAEGGGDEGCIMALIEMLGDIAVTSANLALAGIACITVPATPACIASFITSVYSFSTLFSTAANVAYQCGGGDMGEVDEGMTGLCADMMELEPPEGASQEDIDSYNAAADAVCNWGGGGYW